MNHPVATPRPRVLFVDDNPLAREGLQVLLRDHFEVINCASAREVVDHLGENPGAAVVDLKMPDMDGFALIEVIREHNEHMPVVIYSAYSDLMDPFDLMSRYRPSGYIVKGLNDHKLVEVIKRALEQSAMDADARSPAP